MEIMVYNPTQLLKSGISYFSTFLLVSKISLCENVAASESLLSPLLTGTGNPYEIWEMLWNLIYLSNHNDD